MKVKWIDSPAPKKRKVQKIKKNVNSWLYRDMRKQSGTNHASLSSRDHIKCVLMCLNDHTLSWRSLHPSLSLNIPRATLSTTTTRNEKNETRREWQNKYIKVQVRTIDCCHIFLWVWWASSYGSKDKLVHISMPLYYILTSIITS